MKKAWELEYETMKNALPVVLTEEEQGWTFCEEVEKQQNVLNKMLWQSSVPGSCATEHCIVGAMQDMENMGYDVTEAERLIETGLKAVEERDDAEIARLSARVFHLLANAPKLEGHPYWSYAVYESFGQYAKKARLEKYPFDKSDDRYERLTHYGWQAQICAGALGTAIEGYLTENIRRVFAEIDGYVRTPNTYNDDITYELAFLAAFEQCGRNITSADIAEQWVALIPFGWSAEEIALKNIRLGIYPPESGYRNNPFREWIGAQMRGAICGMVAPGDAEAAARYAFLDGQVSHHNNGVLGEVFNAVMVSLAYVKSDVREILDEAISAIPSDSEYYSVIAFAREQCRKFGDWESAWKVCEQRYCRYNWVHAYPNAAAEVVALYYGEGDFDKTMHIIAMQGYDVDCNAAQIATVVAIAGGKEIGGRWTEPIGDILDTYMRKLKKLSIKELAHRTVTAGRK